MTTLAMSSFQYDSDHFSDDSTAPSMAMSGFADDLPHEAGHPITHPRHPYLSEPSRPAKTTFSWSRARCRYAHLEKVDVQVELDQRGLAIRQKPRRIAVRRQPWKVSEKVAVVKAVATGSRVIISASRSRELVCHCLAR